jgi:hypothetical protein
MPYLMIKVWLLKKKWMPFYGTELLLSTMYGGPFSFTGNICILPGIFAFSIS